MLCRPLWQMAVAPQAAPAEAYSSGFCSGDAARIMMSTNFRAGSGRGNHTGTGARCEARFLQLDHSQQLFARRHSVQAVYLAATWTYADCIVSSIVSFGQPVVLAG